MVASRAPVAQLWAANEPVAAGLSTDQRRRQAAIHHRAFGPATGASMPRGVHRAYSGASNAVRRPTTSSAAKTLARELTFAIWPFPVCHSFL